jgi:hypothetical protein
MWVWVDSRRRGGAGVDGRRAGTMEPRWPPGILGDRFWRKGTGGAGSSACSQRRARSQEVDRRPVRMVIGRCEV